MKGAAKKEEEGNKQAIEKVLKTSTFERGGGVVEEGVPQLFFWNVTDAPAERT